MAKERVKLTTATFRGSFVNLLEPSSFNGGDEKYSITAIWQPRIFKEQDKVLFKKMREELEATSQAAFKKPWKALPSNNRGLRDGIEKDGVEGFGEGTYFANLSSKKKPPVWDAKTGTALIDPDDVYSGAFYRAVVNIYDYDNMSKGVAIGLRQVQKIKDGPRLDGGGGNPNDFEEVDQSWLEEHTDSLLNDPDDDF